MANKIYYNTVPYPGNEDKHKPTRVAKKSIVHLVTKKRYFHDKPPVYLVIGFSLLLEYLLFVTDQETEAIKWSRENYK